MSPSLLVALLLGLTSGDHAQAAEPSEGPEDPGDARVIIEVDEPGASRLAATGVGEVELTHPRWVRLRREPPPVPGPLLLRREVRVRAVEGGVEVRARYWLRSPEPGWFANQLLGPPAHLLRATLDGREATVWSGGQGPLLVEWVDGAATLEVEAFVPGQPRDGMTLMLLGAPRGSVGLEGFDDDIELAAGDERPVVEREGIWWCGASELRLAPRESQPRDRGPLAVASVGVGVTVGDAEVRGQARLRWEIRQGVRSEVSFSVQGVGEDLSVEGPQVSRWDRSGDAVRVELTGPVQGRVDLDLRWSIATPRGAEASVPLPTIVPADVFRSEAAVQVARDGEVDVRPVLDRPWRPIAQAQLPEFAEGLVEGSPTAAFVRPQARAGRDSLQLLRLEPVPGPPVVIQVADLQVATTAAGRVLVQARYELRNERASHLLVTPPPGMRLLGVEVAGRRVTAAEDGEALRIPIKRSIETLKGLLTVPVTVALLGEDAAWARRERRAMPLPAVDAPVAVFRATVHLPPRYRSRLDPGEQGVVEAFTRGNEVAHGLRDAALVARADRLFAAAVDAWNANEFEVAQQQLDALARLSAYGDNAQGLQANVDLVRPRPTRSTEDVTVYDFEDDDIDGELLRPDGASAPAAEAPAPAPVDADDGGAVARRIRARLRARSGKKKAQFERRKSKAKQLRTEGRYEEAAAEYRQAIEDSRDLEVLEDEESVEYDFAADALADELREVEEAGRSSIMKIVTDDAEFDLVSGVFVVLPAADGEDEDATGDANADETVEPEPLPELGPLVHVPAVGDAVRYQYLLLEAGEQRTLELSARRTWLR